MIHEPSDDELIARAARGDAPAFRALVVRFEPIVASVVIGMLGAGDEADDVGQETFIRFHAALGQFRGDASVGTYLRKIAMNLSLNALKQQQRARLRLVRRDDSLVSLDEPVVDAIDMEQVERHAMVHHAVSKLGEKQRSVVVLRLLEGLSTNETAAALQVPVGTVMSRLARGMADLKRLLAPYVQGAPDASR
jgi:RNA polymerase sigma-70 factor (ECF subfamily)